MRPISIPKNITKFIDHSNKSEMTKNAAKAYQAISGLHPEVSIVIPAYNEEKNIIGTLASLCNNKVNRKIEIVVVNNNSADNTESLARTCGVDCINEFKQGIVHARNAGLHYARGKYILNADADTIYPENWIELMIKPLIESPKTALTYGTFSLIPTVGTNRLIYFFYEYLADISRSYDKYFKDESVNVYGFNSGFRRQEGLNVDGYNHPEGTNEDGWFALKVRKKGYGDLHFVNDKRALVWTTDRRIQIDGGIIKGSVKRIKRVLNIN